MASFHFTAKSLQSCPTLCDPIDGSPPGSPVPRVLQARTLEWVAISFSDEWKWKVKGKSLSRVWLFSTPWTVAYQAPLSMGFSRQKYWSGVPLTSLKTLSSHTVIWGTVWLVGLVPKSCPTLATPRTIACQAPLPRGFSRQEYWSGLPFWSDDFNNWVWGIYDSVPNTGFVRESVGDFIKDSEFLRTTLEDWKVKETAFLARIQ